MLDKSIEAFLKYKAFRLRYLSIISTSEAGSGHPTSCLSAADLVSALFFYAMVYDPQNPKNPNNDQFILSKGHAAPLLYAAWAEAGVLNEKDLLTLRQIDSVLEGHPTPRFNRVQAASGSLGQGLSIGAGIALSAKLDKKEFYTYVLMGDSEIAEGQIWEAAEIAAFYKLDNLIGILDVNGLGQRGKTMQYYNVDNYSKKFEAFGLQTLIIDGHDIAEIVAAFDNARNSKQNKPIMIIAKTVKGYGLETVEGKNGYHGKAFPKKDLPVILNELQSRFPKDTNNENDYKWEPKIPKEIDKFIPFEQIKISDPNFKIGEKIATRKAYGQALADLDENCKQLLVLDAEVKNSTFSELLEKKNPNKFIECFIAEQNMISMAVGLTTQNKITFSSTFASFLTRAFDQLRLAAIGKTPLRVCGSHCGVSIGQDGPSQMGLEDIAMFRTLPESVIFYPSDAVSTYKLVQQMLNNNNGITYLRTTRADTPVIYKNEEEFFIGGCKVLHQSNNDKICIVAAGITLHETLKAHEALKLEKIMTSVIDLYCIKPLDSKTLLEIANKSQKKILMIEDHYVQGGIAEAVMHELVNKDIKIYSLGVNKVPKSGKPEELLEFEAIDSNSIISKIKSII